ncbi:MAG: hypothetical protein E6G87_08765 [Alphaproteobacteria bacterium]|nr:MAG: hypothetical protein E6G87_08765 [Alphaproteobacteria bacterium]
MAKRSVSESKADATHLAAMRIIDAEALHRRMKTARLKALRLASESQDEKVGPTATRAAKAKSKRGRILA